MSLTPVNSSSLVLLTPATNFRFFGYFWLVSMTPGKNVIAGVIDTAINCSPVSTTPAINCIHDIVFFFCKTISGRRSRPWPPILSLEQPWKGKKAPHIPWSEALRPPKLLQTKTALFSFDGLRGLWSRCVGCLDATFYGGSNDTNGGHGRHRRPEISPIYPPQPSPILGSSTPPRSPCFCHRQ